MPPSAAPLCAIVLSLVLLGAVSASSWFLRPLRALHGHGGVLRVRSRSPLPPPAGAQETIIFAYRADLLGAWLQGVLLALLEHPHVVAFAGEEVLRNFDCFARQSLSRLQAQPGSCADPWACVGADSKDDHLRYRRESLEALFPYERVVDWEQCAHLDVGKRDANAGLDRLSLAERSRLVRGEHGQEVLGALRAEWARKLPTWLPESYLALHFRAGEVTKFKQRYLHSSAFAALLEREQGKLPVLIFVSGAPPREVDDLSCFRAPGRTVVTEREASAVETLAALAHATVLVTARSSFSYVAALVRAPHLRTLWTPFWHEPPHAGVEILAGGPK